jgi:hypothetical protein
VGVFLARRSLQHLVHFDVIWCIAGLSTREQNISEVKNKTTKIQ